MAPEGLHALTERLATLHDLEAAAAVLDWDQLTYMPPGGAEARGRQLATLGRIAHELLVARETVEALDAASREVEPLPEHDPRRALVRVARRRVERARRLPASLVVETRRHLAASYEVWARARPSGDFAAVRPMLEKTVELSRRHADHFPEAAHPADPLIDEHDPGLDAAQVDALFARLRPGLRALLDAVRDRPPPDTSCLEGDYPEDDQLALGRWVVERLGYDFERGRQDLTHHPFMTRFSIGDVRITTRVRRHDFGDALFSTVHEAGHAMYEQGIDPALEGTLLAAGASSWVHESQSRLWENHVARSEPFWRFLLPELARRFPSLARVPLDRFVRAINRVAPSLVRVDADQLTYDLHVMIRVELERALLEGRLSVGDLPDAWDEAYARDLGVRPPDHRDGVLQDVHWFVALVGGAFQGYTFGNVLSAQVFDAALGAHPEIPAEMAEGRFDRLRAFLVQKLYRHGSVLEPNALVEHATGRPLEVEPYLRLLRAKLFPLYGLDASA